MMPSPRNEQGVSSVLGAILVFGLLVLTLVTIQVTFVPRWEEDREARLSDTLLSQLGVVAAEIDRQTGLETVPPVTVPLTTQSGSGFKFVRGASLPGSVSYDQVAGNAFLFNASQLTIQESNGIPYFALDEVWDDLVDGEVVTDIERILHLRVKVENPVNAATGDHADLILYDAQGVQAGRIMIKAGGDAMYVYTFGVDDVNPISIRLDDTDPEGDASFGPDPGGPTFFFNLLDDNVLFDAVLDATEAPFRLEVENAGGDALDNADFNVVYQKRTPTGIETVGGEIGLNLTNQQTTASGGALRVVLPNQRYPDQVFVYEHGALIREQNDGQVMAIAPGFHPRRSDDQAQIQWNVPTIVGDDSGITTREVSVEIAQVSTELSIAGFTPSFTVTLGTAYPLVWQSFWNETLAAAGFLTGEYGTSVTSSSATLIIYGPITAPSSQSNDILLDIRQATVHVDLSPAG